PLGPGRPADRRVVAAFQHGRGGGQVPHVQLRARPDPTVYLLGGPDRRGGPEHRDPRGRSDHGPAPPLRPPAASRRSSPRRALVASGFVRSAPFALFLLLGASLWVFYEDPGLRSDRVFARFIVTYLPTGVLGLVLAAVFSSAMGTLAGSLNSAASAMVNDLYKPLTGRTDERHLLRLSRALTVVWGVVLMSCAFAATHLKDSVVSNALAIASFVTGILLGLFLLGILTRRVGQAAALVGMIAGVVAVSSVKFGTEVAWP